MGETFKKKKEIKVDLKKIIFNNYMYCCECMDYINLKSKHTYVVINKSKGLYRCSICNDSSRFKTLVNNSKLNFNEKKELMDFKNIMDIQNRTILKLIENLYEKTGLKLF